MSMREHGVTDFGMVIDVQLEKKICEKLGVEGLYDLEDDNMASLGNFSGQIRNIKEDGSLFGTGEELEDESIYYFPTEFAPNFITGAYPSIDKIAEEIAIKAKNYLPEGYPIKDHLCFIFGTIFG